MDNSVLKFAILGCGHIATKMAAAVKALESRGMGVEAYAVIACFRKGTEVCCRLWIQARIWQLC